MKSVLLLTFLLGSFSAFPVSKITLKKDVKLERVQPGSGYILGFADAYKGNGSCSLDLAKESVSDSLVILSGTVLEVTGQEFSYCGNDWGKYCSLSVSGSTPDRSVAFNLLCKIEGIFSSKVTHKKINTISSDLLLVE